MSTPRTTHRQIYITKDGIYLERAHFYSKPEVWSVITKLARQHGLTLSRYIEFLINAEVERQSTLQKGAPQ
jgi:macrodomain Ter protein organizer (MatP/YcbG family)